MQEMVEKLFNSIEMLRQAIDKRYAISEARAKAEYAYREMLGREMAAAKVEGMAATALYTYCRGLEHVAKLREERDILIAQEDYMTELIFYYRTCIKVYEGQAAAERRGL
ncbi:hypothetical protein [Phascolarctobacterium sp.]|uniref:hypothetical protein n=1 Tax=Phascolarctobacterium sp. TaxID=2049039 RepID=UPI00386F7A74